MSEKEQINNIDDVWAEALEEQRIAEEAAVKEEKPGQEAPASKEAAPADQSPKAPEPVKRPRTLGLELLLRIPVVIRIRLGETRLVISDLMQLGQGSIIELDKDAGEKLDLLVNDNLIGRGDVVVVNDRFGLRMTETMPLDERIRSLGEKE